MLITQETILREIVVTRKYFLFLLFIAKQQLAKTKKYFSSIEDMEVLNLECFAFFLGAYSAL